MKKPLSLILIVFTLLVSCNEPERGTPDVETLSKKLFDLLRDNNMEKSALLLPDRGTFRKTEAEKGNNHEDINAVYEKFETTAETNFNTVFSMITTWPNCKYNRATTTESKQGKLTTERVVVKFTEGNNAHKFEYTAVRFNNRWYYYGDVIWIAKTN